MLARVNFNPLLVERPESVPEQTRRVILLLELHQAFPVLAERGCDACGWFAASEELNNRHRYPYCITAYLCVCSQMEKNLQPPRA
jgi:hypothetical protein